MQPQPNLDTSKIWANILQRSKHYLDNEDLWKRPGVAKTNHILSIPGSLPHRNHIIDNALFRQISNHLGTNVEGAARAINTGKPQNIFQRIDPKLVDKYYNSNLYDQN